jgi:hypothetical protein
LYRLKDFNNEPIEGTFYGDELQKVEVDDDTEFKIEEILDKHKTKGGKEEYLVKWLGWPEKFNSFMLASSVKDILKKENMKTKK